MFFNIFFHMLFLLVAEVCKCITKLWVEPLILDPRLAICLLWFLVCLFVSGVSKLGGGVCLFVSRVSKLGDGVCLFVSGYQNH